MLVVGLKKKMKHLTVVLVRACILSFGLEALEGSSSGGQQESYAKKRGQPRLLAGQVLYVVLLIWRL